MANYAGKHYGFSIWADRSTISGDKPVTKALLTHIIFDLGRLSEMQTGSSVFVLFMPSEMLRLQDTTESAICRINRHHECIANCGRIYYVRAYWIREYGYWSCKSLNVRDDYIFPISIRVKGYGAGACLRRGNRPFLQN